MIYNFVLNRPGIQVVQGTVTNFSSRFGTVHLRMEADYVTTQELILHWEADTIAKMRFREGSKVIASITPTEETIALSQGIRMDQREFHVNAHVVRYTGAFDFKPWNDTPEQHVFCGYTGNVYPLAKGMAFEVWWNHRKQKQVRYLYSPVDISKNIKSGSLHLYVSGAPKKSKKGTDVYQIKRLLSFT